jgi:glucose/mannose-6-phosphate isomerase
MKESRSDDRHLCCLMLEDVLAMPDHLRDALWRVESARLEPRDSAGLVVCGMGGSAIGGDLAAAVLAGRLTGPLFTVRGYRPPAWVDSEWTALCSSYSGETEETLSCFEASGELGAGRIVAGTGGPLVERAREAGVPVVGLPGVLQPREAVAYMAVVAAEAAALAGVAPRIAAEIEGAAAFLEERSEDLEARAGEVAARLAGTVPVVYGAELTAPVARRWKTQIDENAKAQAFFSELPEADHNEICGWAGLPEGTRLSVVMVEDAGRHPRLDRRYELTAEEMGAAGVGVIRVPIQGETPTARLFWAVMLGDLVSLRLAEERGIDPTAVEAIDRLKSGLARS